MSKSASVVHDRGFWDAPKRSQAEKRAKKEPDNARIEKRGRLKKEETVGKYGRWELAKRRKGLERGKAGARHDINPIQHLLPAALVFKQNGLIFGNTLLFIQMPSYDNIWDLTSSLANEIKG